MAWQPAAAPTPIWYPLHRWHDDRFSTAPIAVVVVANIMAPTTYYIIIAL